MLNHLLASRYTSSSPPLIVLSDSLVQPGLSIFHQLVSSAPASTHTVLVCAEQCPRRAVPHGLDRGKVELIDCTADGDFPLPSSSRSLSVSTTEVDLSQATRQLDLERALVQAVNKARASSGPVQIAIDGINSLADELGNHGVWRLLKQALKALEGLPLGSRVLVVHHDYFPTVPGTPSMQAGTAPSLLASLLSPLLSSATIHLALHPTSHFHTLSTRFSLTLPSTSSLDETPDLRTTEFLTRLRERGVGDPFRRPERSDEDDERIALDVLGDGQGKAILGWNCRGVTVGKVSRIATAGGGPAGAANEKKVVTWGFEGLVSRHDDQSQSRVEGVELGAVLAPRTLGKSRDEAISSSLDTAASPSSASPSTRPNAASSSTAPNALPFSLSLTPSQLAARSLVANPYEGSNKPIFGEAGYTGRVDEPAAVGARSTATGGGLRVEYTADRGDDLDEEEPDEDLEI